MEIVLMRCCHSSALDMQRLCAEHQGWSSLGSLTASSICSILSLPGVPLRDKLGGMAFDSVSTANQVSLWLNYLCQELNVGLHKQCSLLNKTWIWGWERTLARQVGFL